MVRKLTLCFYNPNLTRYSAEIVLWVSESLRPFNIVEDERFRRLMLTGRPGLQLPSELTVGRDVRKVFWKAKEKIARLLQASNERFVLSA